ncbi:Ribonuclease VapC26 [bacterium HR33]|nr:Ribonuclease VapC26 [bacterium HR33]
MILDTGPLVAVLNRRDEWHDRVAAVWPEVIGRCVTTEAVLTEATHLVSGAPVLPLEFLLRARIPILALGLQHYRHCAVLMRRYADLPMDFADATLVTLSDVLDCNRVFTTDRRGFAAYRKATGERFELIPS